MTADIGAVSALRASETAGSSAPDHHDALPARQARSRVYLNKIMQGATELVERDGIGALTMAAVAAHAGLSTGGIYRRFPDKPALLRALKDAHLAQFERFVIARLDATSDRLDAVVRVFVEAHVDAFSRHPNVFRFIMAPSADALFLARGLAQIQSMEQLFASTVLRFRAEIGGSDPESKARFTFHLVFSMLSYRLRQAGRFDCSWEEVTDQLVAAALSYLAATRADDAVTRHR